MTINLNELYILNNKRRTFYPNMAALMSAAVKYFEQGGKLLFIV